MDWYHGGKWYLLLPSLLLVGLLINLTPCVYPVIAPTAGFIAKQSEGAVGGRFMFGLVFLLGAAAMFAIIGTVFGLTGTVFGSLYQHAWFTIGLGILMMALALAMFDVYQIRLPGALASGMRGRSGLLGALLMGMFIGVAAVPCGGPVIAAAAATAFETRDTVFASLVFTGIGIGIGLPVAILIMTGALGVLAKPGEWMVTVKHVLGLAVIASGIYFLSFTLRPVIGNLGMAWLWAGYFVAAAFYLIALDHTGRTRTGLLAFKGIVAIGAVLYGGMMLAKVTNESNAPAMVNWQPFDLAKFDAALGKGTPIVIDFRADWCAKCREIEDKTFSDPKVQEVLAKMVTFKADETNSNPTSESWNRRFGVATLPDVIFYGGDGKQAQRFQTFFDTGEFFDASKSAGL